MEILTTRFGPISVDAVDRVEFPNGLVGVPQLKRFVLLPDPECAGFVWLQSSRDPAWALALVPPRSVVPDYQMRVGIDQLRPIHAESNRDVEVFVTMNRTVERYTVNLQAPILINRAQSLGIQLVLSDSRKSVRHEIVFQRPLRLSA